MFVSPLGKSERQVSPAWYTVIWLLQPLPRLYYRTIHKKGVRLGDGELKIRRHHHSKQLQEAHV